jgi:hypothetical protein
MARKCLDEPLSSRQRGLETKPVAASNIQAEGCAAGSARAATRGIGFGEGVGVFGLHDLPPGQGVSVIPSREQEPKTPLEAVTVTPRRRGHARTQTVSAFAATRFARVFSLARLARDTVRSG